MSLRFKALGIAGRFAGSCIIDPCADHQTVLHSSLVPPIQYCADESHHHGHFGFIAVLAVVEFRDSFNPGVMSYSYDRYERQRRSTYGASTRRSAWGHWIPLVVTVTVATVGIAAWIWSERKDGDDDDEYDRKDYGGRGEGPPPPGYGSSGLGQPSYAPGSGQPAEDQSMIARMSGAIRRTPSPQQMFDGASRRVVAGVAAAGAAVGGALSSIREEDKKDFEDHSRWSEEAETQASGAPGHRGSEARSKPHGKRKTVAVVLSAESDYNHAEDASYHQEHAVSAGDVDLRYARLIARCSLYYPTCPNMSMMILGSSCSYTRLNLSNIHSLAINKAIKLQCQRPRLTRISGMMTLKVMTRRGL